MRLNSDNLAQKTFHDYVSETLTLVIVSITVENYGHPLSHTYANKLILSQSPCTAS